MKLEEFCQKLDTHLAARPAGQRLEAAMQAVAQAFGVSDGEVALLTLPADDENVLAFCWPKKLSRSGFIPLSTNDSLAARTVRENRPFSNNRFASARHAAVFEQVRLNAAQPAQQPIQKIISAPLPGEKGAKGVVQVSRKGEGEKSVADFSANDLLVLEELAKVLARHL
jgi:hypothetical protein